MDLQQLRDQTPAGYNLAAIVPLGWTWDLDDFARRALPVLKEADGCLGVLRALDLPGRLEGIQRRLSDSGETARLVHLRFLDHTPAAGEGGVSAAVAGSPGVVREWTFTVTLDPEVPR